MPKVTITNAKGLVQSKGSGLVVSSAAALNGAVTIGGTGAEGVALGASTSLVGGAGNADISITQPANTVLVGCGLLATTALDTSDTVVVDFGTSAGGQEIVAQTNATSAGIFAVSTAVSSAGLNAEGANDLVFVTAAAMHTTAARTITCRVTTGATQGAGVVRPWLRYQVV